MVQPPKSPKGGVRTMVPAARCKVKISKEFKKP